MIITLKIFKHDRNGSFKYFIGPLGPLHDSLFIDMKMSDFSQIVLQKEDSTVIVAMSV